MKDISLTSGKLKWSSIQHHQTDWQLFYSHLLRHVWFDRKKREGSPRRRNSKAFVLSLWDCKFKSQRCHSQIQESKIGHALFMEVMALLSPLSITVTLTNYEHLRDRVCRGGHMELSSEGVQLQCDGTWAAVQKDVVVGSAYLRGNMC